MHVLLDTSRAREALGIVGRAVIRCAACAAWWTRLWWARGLRGSWQRLALGPCSATATRTSSPSWQQQVSMGPAASNPTLYCFPRLTHKPCSTLCRAQGSSLLRLTAGQKLLWQLLVS